MKAIVKHWKPILGYALWIVGLALVVYGAIFSTHLVLDKPISSEAVKGGGVKIKVYTEADLVKAVSTDQVERAGDGWLKTVPGKGICES